MDNFEEVTFLAVFYRHKDCFSEIVLDIPCEYHFLVWKGQRGSKEGQNLLFPTFKWQQTAKNFHRYTILLQKFDCDIVLSNHFSWSGLGQPGGDMGVIKRPISLQKYPLEAANLCRDNFSWETWYCHSLRKNYKFWSFWGNLVVKWGSKSAHLSKKSPLEVAYLHRVILSFKKSNNVTHLGQITCFNPFWGNLEIKWGSKMSNIA